MSLPPLIPITDTHTERLRTLWCKVYIANIRVGYSDEEALESADIAVGCYKERFIDPSNKPKTPNLPTKLPVVEQTCKTCEHYARPTDYADPWCVKHNLHTTRTQSCPDWKQDVS